MNELRIGLVMGMMTLATLLTLNFGCSEMISQVAHSDRSSVSWEHGSDPLNDLIESVREIE